MNRYLSNKFRHHILARRNRFNWTEVGVSLILSSVLGAAEELIFRHSLPMLFLSKTTCSILFGLVHFTNYFLVREFKPVLVQVVSTTALGVLFSQVTVHYSILLHVFYNVTSCLVLALENVYLDYRNPRDNITDAIYVYTRRKSLSSSSMKWPETVKIQSEGWYDKSIPLEGSFKDLHEDLKEKMKKWFKKTAEFNEIKAKTKID